MSVELLRHFPLLSPLNQDGTRFLGYITVDDEDYQISISLGEDHSLIGADIHLDTRLRPIGIHDSAVQNCLRHSKSLLTFLIELKGIISQRLKHLDVYRRTDEARISSLTASTALLKELDDVGWENVSSLNADLSRVTLIKNDVYGRPTELRLEIRPEFPTVPPAFSAQLPLDFEYDWKSDSRLMSVMVYSSPQPFLFPLAKSIL